MCSRATLYDDFQVVYVVCLTFDYGEHSDTAANPGCQTINTKTPAIGLRTAGLQSQATVERYTDQRRVYLVVIVCLLPVLA